MGNVEIEVRHIIQKLKKDGVRLLGVATTVRGELLNINLTRKTKLRMSHERIESIAYEIYTT